MKNQVLNLLENIHEAKDLISINDLLHLTTAEELKELSDTLDELVNEYLVFKTKKDKYILLKNCPSLKIGKFSANKKGFGFVILNKEDDLYIGKEDINGAIQDDIVLAEVTRKGVKPEGHIIRVIKRDLHNLVGEIIETKKGLSVKLDEEKLDLISDYTKKHYIWLEYGLQSIHDRSLKFINRGHDFAAFVNALKNTKKRNINVCAHVILGLPNETKQDMLETAKVLGDLGVNGVKIHLLCVLNNTRLAKLYFQGKIPMMEEDEYVETVCDFLELLPPSVTIHRLAGNGLKPNMLAPGWLSKKFIILNKIDKLLEERNSFQGSKL